MTYIEAKIEKGTSLWGNAWRRLSRNRMALISAGFVFSLIVLSFIGPFFLQWIWGYDYETQNLAYGAKPPSLSHWFGTDYFGRDLLTRTLYGTQISLAVGFLAASVAALIGTIYGATSGYLGGRVDGFMMRVVDVLYTLPYMFLVICSCNHFWKESFSSFRGFGSRWMVDDGPNCSWTSVEFKRTRLCFGG